MIKKLAVVLIAIFTYSSYAQQGTSSPYSFYGIGSLKFKGRLKIEEENSLLKAKSIKLENELFNLKKELNNQKTSEEEMKFLELNLLYGRKCKKTFYNKLYKVGTTEYRECVLKKGKN